MLHADALRAALDCTSLAAKKQLDRILHEIGFAEGLCTLHPKRKRAWKKLITRATAEVSAASESPDVRRIARAVTEAEAILVPIGRVAKTYTMHCVGHAHIDMNWMWSWPETVAVTIDTFLTVLKLMEEFPTFRFSQSQGAVYAILEEHRPDLLARIAERVKEGRWEVTASHWVEGDKNLSGGEALCRHLLYTRRYMQRLFGLAPEDVPIDWSPDTFGHAATVPTYLSRGGVRYCFLHRPGVHTNPKSLAFWWEGPDGSRVLVQNDMAIGYNNRIGPWMGEHLIRSVRETGAHIAFAAYGVGDHGGGPTRRDLIHALDMDSWPVFPTIKLSTVRAYFEALEAEATRLPTVTGELNTEFTGCYTTQSLIKKANRYGENRLANAELAGSLAWAVLDLPYPSLPFENAWRDVLFSQFHDILPGSGVHDTRTYTHGLYQKAVATSASIETQALRAIAARIDTSASEQPPQTTTGESMFGPTGAGVGFRTADGGLSGGEQSAGTSHPFVVFNTTAEDREEVIEATVWEGSETQPARPSAEREFSVRDAEGRAVPAQTVTSGKYWGHDFVTLAFPASVVGFGYALYSVTPQRAADAARGAWQIGPEHHCRFALVERVAEGLENDLLRVELDGSTGGVRRLVHKPSGLVMIEQPQAQPLLEYLIERPHGMSAWLIDHGQPAAAPRLHALRRKLKGPYKVAIELVYRIAESEMTLELELRAGDPRLHLRLTGTWFQRGSPDVGVPTLRLALPLTLTAIRGRYEVPFGAIDRPDHDGQEVPALRWGQVTGKVWGKTAGLHLATDCKHGYALHGPRWTLTLIRSAYMPDPLPEIGQHEVKMSLLAFEGELPQDRAIASADRLNHPLRVVGTDAHVGELPPSGRFLAVEPSGVMLTAVKRAEDGDGLVLRLCEVRGKNTKAKLWFNEELLGRPVEAESLDLMERPSRSGRAGVTVHRGWVFVSVPARDISTIRVGF